MSGKCSKWSNAKKVAKWRDKNRDKWNAKQREMYARRKAEQDREIAAISARVDEIARQHSIFGVPPETSRPGKKDPRKVRQGKTHIETVALRTAHRKVPPLLLDDDMRAYVGKKAQVRW